MILRGTNLDEKEVEMLERIKISDIKNMTKEEIENLNFHFTLKKREKSIDLFGLQKANGNNSKGEHRK